MHEAIDALVDTIIPTIWPLQTAVAWSMLLLLALAVRPRRLAYALGALLAFWDVQAGMPLGYILLNVVNHLVSILGIMLAVQLIAAGIGWLRRRSKASAPLHAAP